MANKGGRFNPMQRNFVKVMARVNDATYAATKAGYSNPTQKGSEMMKKPAIQEATFAEVQRFLRDQGAAIGVYTLAELAVDTAIPAGVRRAAASDLAKLSGVGVSDAAQGKEPHEMTAAELRDHASKLERQRDAMLRMLADQARPVIEVEQGQDDDVFG
jgi:phage terminase small subunit